MLKFILNLLFVIGGCFALPLAILSWLFGRLWVNAPLDYTPSWLWIISGISLLTSLILLKEVKNGWGQKFFHSFWSSNQ